MWSEMGGETEKWFLGKRKNANHSYNFVLPSPFAFSWHHFQWLLQHSSSKHSSNVLYRIQQRRERIDQPPACLMSGFCVCNSSFYPSRSTFSNLHLTSLFHLPAHTTEPFARNHSGFLFLKVSFESYQL